MKPHHQAIIDRRNGEAEQTRLRALRRGIAWLNDDDYQDRIEMPDHFVWEMVRDARLGL